MIINLQKIKIKDLFEGYIDKQEEGVYAYGGKLNIRPKYQREFTYELDKQIAVIETIIAGFPLSVMYWIKGKNGSYELLDGQQRSLSICKFLSGDFDIQYNNISKYFKNFQLSDPQIAVNILNYELMCYFCEDGSDEEKLKWFRTINIAGKTLNNQELLNASYTGEWLTSAKAKFSKSYNCPAQAVGEKYLSGKPIEQDYLETALKWIAHRDKITIESYMAKNQDQKNCNELWSYYKSVITWVEQTFIIYRKELRGLEFGELYNDYYQNNYDGNTIEKEFEKIHQDSNINSSVQNIYRYLITGNENLLNRRAFDDKIKRKVFEKQKTDKNSDLSKCSECNNLFKFNEMEGDHIKPWSKGGKSTIENCQMLCKDCNGKKSNKH